MFLSLGSLGCNSGDQAVPKQPNILIVVADDLAHAALGDRYGLTPEIDRLIAESVAFEHATASSPFCTPSRQSFLTGRWPHAIGVTQVNSLLPAGVTTMGDAFRGSGYRTAAHGKMHWQRRRAPSLDRGFDQIQDITEWREQLSPSEREAYDRYRDIWRGRNEEEWLHLNPDARPLPLPEHRQYASWLVDRTLDFIDDSDDEPYLAVCSFSEVHTPFSFPPSYAGRVKAADIDLPSGGTEDLLAQAPGVLSGLRSREQTRGPLTE